MLYRMETPHFMGIDITTWDKRGAFGALRFASWVKRGTLFLDLSITKQVAARNQIRIADVRFYNAGIPHRDPLRGIPVLKRAQK